MLSGLGLRWPFQVQLPVDDKASRHHIGVSDIRRVQRARRTPKGAYLVYRSDTTTETWEEQRLEERTCPGVVQRQDGTVREPKESQRGWRLGQKQRMSLQIQAGPGMLLFTIQAISSHGRVFSRKVKICDLKKLLWVPQSRYALTSCQWEKPHGTSCHFSEPKTYLKFQA